MPEKRKRTNPPHGMIIGLIFMTAFLACFLFFENEQQWYLLLGIPSVVILGLGFAEFFTVLSNHSIMEQRHKQALKILRELKSGETPEPYTLYLRPFKFDREFVYRAGENEKYSVELEEVFANATNLIALDQDFQKLGAGSIPTSDEAWKSDIHQLICSANFIIYIPSPTSGSMFELGVLIGSGRIESTIFLNPPDPSPGYSEWPSALKSAAKLIKDGFGIVVPDSCGKVFRISKDLKTVRSSDFPVSVIWGDAPLDVPEFEDESIETLRHHPRRARLRRRN